MTECRRGGHRPSWTYKEIASLSRQIQTCRYYKTITIPNRSDRAIYIMIHRLKLHKLHLGEDAKTKHKRLKNREYTARYRQKLKARELS